MDAKILNGFGLCVLALSANGLFLSAATKDKKDKMNVVYILADDMGYGDLSCTGQVKFSTPNIDRLRAEGMLFTNHYAGCTVSAPSRSSLMTGQHTGHTFIRGNVPVGTRFNVDEGQFPLPARTYTIAKMFKEAGYVTGAFGKWGLGYPGSEGDPINQGFDEFYGYNCQREAHRYYTKHLWHNGEKIILEENIPYYQKQYAPDIIHSEALKFIRDHSDENFFLYVPVILPHAELIVPEDEIIEKYRGKYEEKPFEAETPKAPYGPKMGVASYCPQPEPYATYAAMVARIDKYVGEIVDEIKRQGLEDNTIIFFTSDNGPHCEGGANPDYFNSNGPFRGIKRDLYEGGIRLPLIAWAPGRIKANTTNDHICAFWDMLPTFAQMTDVDISPKTTFDGISIVPSLFGKGRQKEHDYLYWEFYEQDGKAAIRDGKWKLIVQNIAIPGLTSVELYNLEEDVHEDNNIAESHPKIVKKLCKKMREAHADSEYFIFAPQKKRNKR